MNGNKLTQITMLGTRAEKLSIHLVAKIEENGRLVLEGYDTGETVKEIWGDWDYEYWLRIEPDYKDTILLWLIQERFSTDAEFMEWLKQKGIPYEFESYE